MIERDKDLKPFFYLAQITRVKFSVMGYFAVNGPL